MNNRSDEPRRVTAQWSTTVAVVIPILNEARSLGRTLDALTKQDYPRHLVEILIVDGGSTDDWQTIARQFQSTDLALRCLPNPGRTAAAAVNLALRETDAKTILWISGHCLLSPQYLSAAVAEYEKYPGAVVGGRLEVVGHGVASTLYSLVLRSRFGTGAAPFRFHTDPGPAVSVTYALFERALLQSVGGVDEQLIRNQDSEIFARLRKIGTPIRRINATATYLAPSQLRGIWRRAWGNGAWNIWALRLGKGGVSWWHLMPMAAVGLAIALLILSIWSSMALNVLIVLAGLYLLLALGVALMEANPGQAWTIPVLPVLFFVHHAVYGLGSWQALLREIPSPLEVRPLEHN